MSSPPTMGIGTSSSSSGASAPRANAYAVNRDASELRRSHARKAPASAQPDPMHVIYMYMRRAIRAADPADSCVQARTAPRNRRQKHLQRRVPRPGTTRARPGRTPPHTGMHRLPAAAAGPRTCCLPAMTFHALLADPRHRATPQPSRTRSTRRNRIRSARPARERHTTQELFSAPRTPGSAE
jgi:hypothetical protein